MTVLLPHTEESLIELSDDNLVSTAEMRRWMELITDGLPKTGSGSPEGVLTASIGTLYLRADGGTGTTLYVKESGTGDTGWVAK